jgi:hypothetical protein
VSQVWRRLLDPFTSSLLAGVSVVWLFDAALALHPAVNPLPMLVDMMVAVDAEVLHATPRALALRSHAPPADSTTTAAPPSGGLIDGKCIAATTTRVALSPFVLVRREAWHVFHTKMLSRLHDAPQIAHAHEEALCSILSRSRAPKPGCVEIARPRIDLLDPKAYEREASTDKLLTERLFGPPKRQCAEDRGCARVLGQAAVSNASRWQEPLCWIYGMQKEGVSLDRASRTRLSRLAAQKRQQREASLQKRQQARVAEPAAWSHSHGGG